MYDFFKLLNTLKDFNLSDYDIIYVASSGFANYWDKDFDQKIIEALVEIMKDKTLIMPSFSFDFCDHKIYSVTNSTTFCGSICEKFRKLPNVKRTMFPPVHNVSIFGKLQSVFCDKKYTSSFGEDSIFNDLNNYNCGILLIDCSFDDGVPFVHCLEEKYDSTYREKKKFEGIIEDYKNNKIAYEFYRYSRKKGVILSAKDIGNEFYKTTFVKQKENENSIFCFFELNKFYSFFEPIWESNPNIMKQEGCVVHGG
ncbi:MAG: AAC(3) family N-acetyltransferase [Oscillospiraceae bacterium]|nr:AAC(3) family N-acetyltransferase [Oscillospiraceae bacterium]